LPAQNLPPKKSSSRQEKKNYISLLKWSFCLWSSSDTKLFENGLIEETQQLIRKYGKELSLLQTIGYKESLEVIQGNYSLAEALESTIQRTNQFAKKQRTWFRRQHNPKWLNEKNSLDEALSLIQNVIG